MPTGIYKRTEIHKKTQFKKGAVPCNKGLHHSDATKLKMSKARKGRFSGENHPNWKGGRYKRLGYFMIYSPNHPHRTVDGYVLEHRLVMEKKIGRYLKPKESVHHINAIPTDNRPENLMLFKNNVEHGRFETHWKKLDIIKVRKIRKLAKESILTHKKIAKKFNISLGGCRSVIYKVNWAWVK